jgi:hypothetical protein
MGETPHYHARFSRRVTSSAFDLDQDASVAGGTAGHPRDRGYYRDGWQQFGVRRESGGRHDGLSTPHEEATNCSGLLVSPTNCISRNL